MAETKEVLFILQGRNDANPAFQQLTGNIDGAKNSVDLLASAFGRVMGPLAGGLAIKEIVNTAVAWQGYSNALKAVTGSAEGATAELGFVRKISNELGLDLDKTTADWVQFAAATKGSALEGAR